MRQRTWPRVCILAALFAVVLAIGLYAGRGIPYADQLRLNDALRNISAIIFGVMGAWIAILYPNGLSSLFKLKPSDGNAYRRVKQLMLPVKCATIIVAVTLVSDFVGAALKQVAWVALHREWFRAINYAVLAAMAFLLLGSLLLTFWPFEQAQKTAAIADNASASFNRRRHNQSSGGPTGR